MKKNALILIFLLLGGKAIADQDPVLMRVNGKEILRSEFEYAYSKEKATTRPGSAKEYAATFAENKLKIAAAEAAGLDTAKLFQEEMEECRRRLVRSYLTDEAAAEQIARQTYDKRLTTRRGQALQVAHIFKYLPQNISGHALREVETKVDSVYALLRAGGNFDDCLRSFSDEKSPFWTTALHTTTEFEEVVFNLQPGEFSKPFFTPRGIHIAKLIERKAPPSFDEVKEELIERQARRYDTDKATAARVETLKKAYNYTPDKAGIDDLLFKGHTTRSLFALDGKIYTGSDFARFSAVHTEGLAKLFDRFVVKSVLAYESSRLEHKHPDLRRQIQRVRDSLLLNLITTRELSSPPNDDASLKAYFEAHRAQYNWKEPRYKGIVLHCSTKNVAKQARKLLKEIPENEWANAIRLTFNASAPHQVKAEQGLFAQGSNAYVDRKVFKGGKVPPIESHPFTIIIGHKQKGPDHHQELEGQLIKDRQKSLEAGWISRLKAAGKVEINQEVLKTVNNH